MTPEIVLGPPGTGKTTRLLGMVEDELASGTAPDRIGYVSFTKQASNEAISRACEKFDLSKRDLRYFRTLHSMCFNVLGLSNSDVFEGKKMAEFGEWIGEPLTATKRMDDTTLFGFTRGDRAMFMENLARVKQVPLYNLYRDDDDDMDWIFVERMSKALRQYKKDQHLIDYTDMLERFADTHYVPKLDVLFVDEAQDLSMLQWGVVNRLAKSCHRLVIAGDDDQAIYRWAGAAVEHFVDLGGNVTVLGKSWRVPKSIQRVASRVIKKVIHRRDKQWSPREDDGVVNRLQSIEELDLSSDDIMILARNAFVLKDAEELLKSEGIIYTIRGQSSVKQDTLDAVKLWEALRAGKTLLADEARTVYQHMSSGIGVQRGYKTLAGFSPDHPVTIDDLKQKGGLLRGDIWHDALDRIPQAERVYLLRALRRGESLTARPRVRLSTIHGSKGGEADHVVILTDMARRTYNEMSLTPEDEARVWYVAVTRAREQLSIVAPSSRMYYDL